MILRSRKKQLPANVIRTDTLLEKAMLTGRLADTLCSGTITAAQISVGTLSGGLLPTPPVSGSQCVIGEAGPEVIMPLKRAADGKLGVITSGQFSINETYLAFLKHHGLIK